MQSSLQSPSLPTYQRAWNLIHRFNSLTFPGFPITVPMFCLFIAYLYDLKYAASTVHTYVFALSYSHKLSGYPDPSIAFVVVQMLKVECSFRQQASYYHSYFAQTVAVCFVITIDQIPNSYVI